MTIFQTLDEKQLYKIWEEGRYNDQLKTVDGDKIAVLDIGERDPDKSGPDYKDARVKIGNFLFVGDIEIDTNYTNWKSHGHNIDGKYNKTVLHISLFNKHNQPYVYTKEGRKVPTTCLSEILDSNILQRFKDDVNRTVPHSNSKIRCQYANEEVKLKIKENLLKELGYNRFSKKCDKIYYRLKELKFLKDMHIKEPVINYELKPEFIKKEFKHSDFFEKDIWNQLFYELIFEALGYSKNKSIMMKLAQSASISFLQKLYDKDATLRHIEAALFNISGMMPKNLDNPQSKYIADLKDDWEKVRRIYDGVIYNKEDWYFFKLRPQNFPTLRVAGGAKIIHSILYDNLIEKIVQKFDEIHNPKVLLNSIRSLFVIRARGYWSEHYIFEKPSSVKIKYYVGATRANEILINVVLPLFAVYFDIFANNDVSKKILNCYGFIEQTSENKIVREVAVGLNAKSMQKSTLLTQGMLELFRNYCSKDKCLECAIGKEVFD